MDRDGLCLGGRRDPEQIVVEPDVVDPGLGDRVVVSLASPPTRERQGTRQGPMKLRSPTAGSCEIEDFGRPCSVRARKSLRIGRRIRRFAAKRNLGPGWCGDFQLRAGLAWRVSTSRGPAVGGCQLHGALPSATFNFARAWFAILTNSLPRRRRSAPRRQLPREIELPRGAQFQSLAHGLLRIGCPSP